MADTYLDPVSGKQIPYLSTCAAITDALENGDLSAIEAAEMMLRCLGDKPVGDSRGSADEWGILLGKLLIMGGPALFEYAQKILAIIKLFA